MRILVTGAAGFIGHHMVRRLVEQGHSVRALVHSRRKARMRLAEVLDDVELVEGDITDHQAVRPAVRGVDAVMHLVAIPIEKGNATYERINYRGTVNVVDAAVEEGVERFIHLSQNGSNAKSFSPFLGSKGRSNEYLEASPLAWTMMHPSLAFGEGDKVFNTMARLVRLTPFVFPNIQGGETEFQPVSVHDVVDVTTAVLDDDATIHEHYDLGGPEVLRLGEITRRVIETLRERRVLVSVPVAALAPWVYLMHRLLPQPPASVELLRLLRVPNVVLHANAFERFGVEPRPFQGEHIAYLRQTSAREALRIFFGHLPE